MQWGRQRSLDVLRLLTSPSGHQVVSLVFLISRPADIQGGRGVIITPGGALLGPRTTEQPSSYPGASVRKKKLLFVPGSFGVYNLDLINTGFPHIWNSCLNN